MKPFAFRSAKLWAITRSALSAVFFLAGDNPLRLSIFPVLGIVALVTVLGAIELRRNREMPFIGNLGVSPLLLSAILLGPVAIGELTLASVGFLTR
ncbi:MAG: hypothetical protein H0W69_07430 [Gemmatimonadaceae bacterium]|nr:hypothetical protein [Gemmatimonadaceae bacterium]